MFWKRNKLQLKNSFSHKFSCSESQVVLYNYFNLVSTSGNIPTGNIPTGDIIVVTTHLKAKEDPNFAILRSKQVNEMMEFLQVCFLGNINFSTPLIICGDFNDTPDSKAVTDLLMEYNLFCAPSPPFTTYKKRSDEKCHIIDYIFHNSCIKHVQTSFVKSGVVYGDNNPVLKAKELFPDFMPSETYPSDHTCLWVMFEIS